MSERAITKWVRFWGELLDPPVDHLSAHDLRHYCATDMASKGYDIRELLDWFGWNSPAMALCYINSVEVQQRYKV